jgi:hypothetical protein
VRASALLSLILQRSATTIVPTQFNWPRASSKLHELIVAGDMALFESSKLPRLLLGTGGTYTRVATLMDNGGRRGVDLSQGSKRDGNHLDGSQRSPLINHRLP